MLAPALDRLAAEFSGKARIVKVNVDREPAPVSQFHVSSIPNLAFLVDGEIVGQSAGAPTEAALRRALSQLIGQAV
jgi:thioredoxin 1